MDIHNIVIEINLVVLSDGTVDKYVLVVEFEEELWFQSYSPSDTQPSLTLKLPRSLVNNNGNDVSVIFHVYGCKNNVGCGPAIKKNMGVPNPLRNLQLNEVGNPGDGLELVAYSGESSGWGDASELQYRVFLGQPMLRFTFDDMLDPLRADSVHNWGHTNRWGTKGYITGTKPTFFEKSPGDRAVSIMSGNLQGIDIKWSSAQDLLGPPFTIGFWVRSESREATTDIFWAIGSDWWNFIRIYIERDYLHFSQNNYRDTRHTLNVVQSPDKIPYMEWRYVVVSASIDQTHANPSKMKLNVLKPGDLASVFDLYNLVKTGHSCQSEDHNLGNAATLNQCAEKCQATSGCRYFYYDQSSTDCKQEKTLSRSCEQGWTAVSSRNFYYSPGATVKSRKNWDNKGGSPKKEIRQSKIGGRQQAPEMGIAGKGSFSLSDFVVYDRELTKVEKYAEFTVGTGMGSIDLNSISTTDTTLQESLGLIPSGYDGLVDIYAWLCNPFGCSPKVGASLGPPTPPKLLSATVDQNGQVVLDFSAPTSSGGSSYASINFEFGSSTPVVCDLEKELFANPAVMTGLYSRFDAAISVNQDESSPAYNTFLNNGWYSTDGTRKFVKHKEAGQYIENGINGLPSVRLSTEGYMALEDEFDGDNYAVYFVGRRTSTTGRLVSSKNENWIIGWHANKVGVAHTNRWCPNNGNKYDHQVRTGGSTIQSIMSFKTTGRNKGRFYVDGKWTEHDNCYAGNPGNIALGGWHRNHHEKAAGEIAAVILYKPAPSAEVHNLINAYLAWKWKPKSLMSDTEKAMLSLQLGVWDHVNNVCTPTTEQFKKSDASIVAASALNNEKDCGKAVVWEINEWTLGITSQDITESIGVTVTQTISAVVVTGTLKTALTGDTTSIVIHTAAGVTFVTSADLVIGSTTVVFGNIGTITTDGEPRKTQGIAVNPTLSPTCKMILSGENSNGDSVLIQAGDSATQTTTFTKSPESIPLSSIADIALKSCNRFGCSSPAYVRVQPPAAPIITSLRVVNAGKLQVIFEKPSFNGGSELSHYVLHLIDEAVTKEPFMTNRIASQGAQAIITYDIEVGVGQGHDDSSGAGEWEVSTDATVTSLTVNLVACNVLGCTSIPSFVSTSSPAQPTAVTRQHSTDDDKLIIDVTNPSQDGGLIVTGYLVEWHAYVACGATCLTFSNLIEGNIVTGHGILNSVSNAAAFVNNADGSVVTLPLTVIDWTLTLDAFYVAELKHVSVKQGTAKGILKNDIGTTWVFGIADESYNELQGVLVTQGDTGTGFLQTALSGSVTEIIVSVTPGAFFDTSLDLLVGDTTIPATVITSASCTITELVIVAAFGTVFNFNDELTVGSHVIAGEKLTAAASTSSVLSSTLRVRTAVKACNTIGCGDAFFTWNTDVDATLSTLVSFNNIPSNEEGQVAIQMEWNTQASIISDDVAQSLSTLLHVTVPYTDLVSKTIKRATGWIFNASLPDFASDSIIVNEFGVSIEEENTKERGTVVYEVLGMEKGEYKLQALTKCPINHNKWFVKKPGGGLMTWNMPTYDETEIVTWDVFQDFIWVVESPGQKIWIVLQPEHSKCVIVSLQLGLATKSNVRTRFWPPAPNSPIMQEYMIAPWINNQVGITKNNICSIKKPMSAYTIFALAKGYGVGTAATRLAWSELVDKKADKIEGDLELSREEYQELSDIDRIRFNTGIQIRYQPSRLRSDLCGVRSIFGSVPVNIQGRHCNLAVNVPDPNIDSSEYSSLLGSSSSVEYYDLKSESPNLVKTDGWLATKSSLTAAQQINLGERVIAMGWVNFLDCSGSRKYGDSIKQWTESKGRSCPTSNTECYTIHGPFDRDVVGVQKIFPYLKDHTSIKIKLRLWKADSWDNERITVKIDGINVIETELQGHTESLSVGFEQVKFCAYEKWANWGQLYNGIFEATVPHVRETAIIEISANLGSVYTDEYFGFDLFEIETSGGNSGGGIYDISTATSSLEIQNSIETSCSSASSIYTHQPALIPPTKLTEMSAYPDTCYDPPNQCVHKAGTVQLKWRQPRVWGYTAEYRTRTYEVEYTGYVEGIGLVDDASLDPSSEPLVPDDSIDETSTDDTSTGDTSTGDDTSADDTSADDTSADDTSAAEVTEVKKWPITSQDITLSITSQPITEIAGVTVTQGTSTGTLKTALSNEWTLAITAQTITESAGVAVTQGTSSGTLKTALSNEWTLSILNAPVVAETVGVTVTQGSATGILKTTLSGGATSVVIETASGITFLNNADIIIGTTSLVHANIDTATNNGATTSIVIETDSGVTFVATADIVIGSTSVVLANINTATNNGATSSILIQTAAGVTFVTSADLVIGSTTVVVAQINTVDTVDICAKCFIHKGVVVLNTVHSPNILLTNLYTSTIYTLQARAVTSVGGAGEWSEATVIESYNGADPPLRITSEPERIVAEPERMQIRWLIPDWRGSPVTELIIERTTVGECGLAGVQFEEPTDPEAAVKWQKPYQEIIPIDPQDYVNMPHPHYIDVWVGNCLDEAGEVKAECEKDNQKGVNERKKLQSNTKYVFRAKAVNSKGAASDFSDCCTRILKSGISQSEVVVSHFSGNDTACEKNDPSDPNQKKEKCKTIHNALKFNEFENVNLKLHPGEYNAHPKGGKAIIFKRNGMGMAGTGDSWKTTWPESTVARNTEAVINCNTRSCIDIDFVQKLYAPSHLQQLTFTNASTKTDFYGDRSKGSDIHKHGGAVIRLVGQQDPLFKGIEIKNCIFEMNTAKGEGGVIFADCSEHTFTLTFQDVLFRQNHVDSKRGGGALRVHKCSTKMERVKFDSNTAINGGGGAARFSLGSLKITDQLVAINNVAGGRDGGGAFRLNGTALNMEDKNNVCHGNVVTHQFGSGGACLYAEYATLDIRGWNISSNIAETFGGAIRCMGSKLNVRNSIFSRNTAKKEGGSISGMLCNSKFIGSTFSHNTAGIHDDARNGVGYGGAISLGPGSGAEIRSSSFVRNEANAGGGAFSCDACDENVLLFNTSFLSNHARVGGAVFLYETKIMLRALGPAQFVEQFTSIVINDTLPSTFNAKFRKNSGIRKNLAVGQQLLLTTFSSETSATTKDVEEAEILLVTVTQLFNKSISSGLTNKNEVRMKVVKNILPEGSGSGRGIVQIIPTTVATLSKLEEHLAQGKSYFLNAVPNSQIFRDNIASESGGGAIYWDSSREDDKPHVDPVYGAATFSSNRALYGINFASAGTQLQGQKFYKANNTLPFRPILRLEDFYSQTVVNKDISQSITVFAKAIEKLFGKTDSTMEEDGYAHFPTVGMASEPGLHNCSFVASSSRIADFSAVISMGDCQPGTFLRNQETVLRRNRAEQMQNETGTVTKLRYDEELPCPDGEYCRWECTDCPIGRYTNQLSKYSCIGCPKGFIQQNTGSTNCIGCPVGKYARETASAKCENAEIDLDLPNNFKGLRFLANPSPYLNTLAVTWENTILQREQNDIAGIQVRISLGNAAFFDSKIIADVSLDLTSTSVEFDLSSLEIENRCKVVLHGLFCLPVHLMKYYTQVRVYTNNGKVGQNAFPAETWNTASECSDREYLDDYSCPLCPQIRSKLTEDVDAGDQEATFQLATIPSIEQVQNASSPGSRLLNPLVWTCMDCPEGATCRGDILYSGIVSLFGWWRVEKSTTPRRPEIFQRCLYPPACLGAPNMNLAGRFYDKVCTDKCKQKCNGTAAIAGQNFDQGSCDYKCGFETTCDKALVDTISCGGNDYWGEKQFYFGDHGWPGVDNNVPTLEITFPSFIFTIQKGSVAKESTDCDVAISTLQKNNYKNPTMPLYPFPTCEDGKLTNDLGGAKASVLPVHMLAFPKYADVIPPPPSNLKFSVDDFEVGKSEYFYTNINHTVWSLNTTRHCFGYKWNSNTEEKEKKKEGDWESLENVCSTKLDLTTDLTWNGLKIPDLQHGRTNWIVYDLESIHWWNNITRTRHNEIRGFVYSSFEVENDQSILESKFPSISVLVQSDGAKVLEVSFEAKTAKQDVGTNTYVQIQKSQKTICNMGFEDPTKTSLYSRCDKGRGLICEKCDSDAGYMQECINPKGSRCRLCASCDAGYKRAGQARCKKCPPATTNRILLVVGILAMILAASILIYMAIEAADAKDNVSDAMKKIVINYLQVTSLAAGFPLKWPEPVEQMFAAMAAVSSAGQHILSPDCELSWMEPAEAFYSKQVMFASLPVVIIICSKIIWLIIIPCINNNCRKDKRRNCSYYMDRTILTDVVFCYFLYPTTVKQAIGLFACDKIGDGWYLSADLQEVCVEGRHLWWMLYFGFPQVGAYVFGLPFLGWMILVKNRYQLHKRQIRFRYGLLYAGYRRSTFWWEGVVALRKVMFVVIAGVFGSRMGPDLQCFIALFVLFWFFNFHLTAHPFDEITSRHRVLQHIETWAIIVGWCTMWMGLIFYLGNEFGRIDRFMMTVFTIAIIGMNSIYIIVVMYLFFKEYVMERMEAKEAREHEKMVSKLAAHMHAQLASPDRKNNGDGSGMVDAAASLLDFTATTPNKSSSRKSIKQQRTMKRRLTKKAMSSEQLERMDTMLHTQRAFDAIERMQIDGSKFHKKLDSERQYQKGRMARRLKQRALERKLGITQRQHLDNAEEKQKEKQTSIKKMSKFSAMLGGNKRVLHRLRTISKLSSSMHKARLKTEYMEVKFWGVPTGITFITAKNKFSLKVSSIKHKACDAEGRNLLLFGDVLIGINGIDVRGMPATEVKGLCRKTIHDQGSHSISEIPKMWYMIFRRGDAIANAESFKPRELCIQHGLAEKMTGWSSNKTSEVQNNDGENNDGGIRRSKSSLFRNKLTKVGPSIRRSKTEENL